MGTPPIKASVGVNQGKDPIGLDISKRENRGGIQEKPAREKPRAWGIPLHVNGVVCGQSKTIYVLLHLKAVNTSRALLLWSEAAWWMDRRPDSATQ